MKRTKRPRVSALNIFLALTLLAAGPTLAGKGDSTAAVGSAFHYQPFSEAELNDAVQKPLTLDDCIRIALSKNLTLRLSQGELAKAEALHSGSYGQFLPVFTFASTKTNTLTRERTTVKPDSFEVFVESNFANNSVFVGGVQQYLPTGATLQFTSNFRREVNVPLVQPVRGLHPTSRDFIPTSKAENRVYEVSFTQPLLRGAWPTVARSNITLAEYDRQIQEKGFVDATLNTVFQVKQAFYNVLRDRQLIEVNEGALKNDSLLVHSSEAMVKAQLATRRDVLSAEIRLSDDRATLIKSQNDYQRSLDLLKEVLGLPLEMPIELVDMELSYSPIDLNEAALIRSALQNNPAIHGAEVAIQRSRLQLAVKKNLLLPQFDLVASYSPNRKTDVIQNIDLSQTGGWQASLVFSYPFLNREAAGAAENAQIAFAQEQDRLANLQRQIVLNVRDIVRTVYSSAEEINAIERNIEVAEEKLNFSTTMFNLGRASNLDITDAQEALLKAQNKYVSKLADYHTQLALLESLTGQAVMQSQ